MVCMIALDICYTPMYQTIVVEAEKKVLRSTAGRVQYIRFPLNLSLIHI